jgi:hypothetical protein
MMTQIYERAEFRKPEAEIPPSKNYREFMIASVRTARARVQLLQLELDEIGIALKLDAITPDIAAECLHDLGALGFVNPAVFGETTGAPA